MYLMALTSVQLEAKLYRRDVGSGGRELVVEGHKKAVKASASSASASAASAGSAAETSTIFCYLFL